MSAAIEESDRIKFLRAALAQRQTQATEARSALIKLDAEYQQEAARLYAIWLEADGECNGISAQLDAELKGEIA